MECDLKRYLKKSPICPPLPYPTHNKRFRNPKMPSLNKKQYPLYRFRILNASANIPIFVLTFNILKRKIGNSFFWANSVPGKGLKVGEQILFFCLEQSSVYIISKTILQLLSFSLRL